MSGIATAASFATISSGNMIVFVLGILFFQNNVKFSEIVIDIAIESVHVIMTMTYKHVVFKATINRVDLSVEFEIPPAVHEWMDVW